MREPPSRCSCSHCHPSLARHSPPAGPHSSLAVASPYPLAVPFPSRRSTAGNDGAARSRVGPPPCIRDTKRGHAPGVAPCVPGPGATRSRPAPAAAGASSTHGRRNPARHRLCRSVSCTERRTPPYDPWGRARSQPGESDAPVLQGGRRYGSLLNRSGLPRPTPAWDRSRWPCSTPSGC